MARSTNSKTPVVGRFFESHIATLLGLKEWYKEGINGDLELNGDKLWLVVEVKASDNNHHFRISLPQLKRYLEVERFPLDGCVYCLVGYKNRGTKGFRKSLLAKCRTQQDIEIFLANNMDSIYILDSLLLGGLSRKHGSFVGTIPFQPELETIVVKRTWLKELISSPKQTLLSLGFESRSWRIEERQMNINLKAGLLGTISPEIKVVYAVRKKFLLDVQETIRKSQHLLPLTS